MSKKVQSKAELATAIIKIMTIFNNIKLSDTQVEILAYFMLYGVSAETKRLLLKSGVSSSMANIKMVMVDLKKKGLIYRDDLNGKVYVTPSLKLELTSSLGFYLKIDTVADEYKNN